MTMPTSAGAASEAGGAMVALVFELHLAIWLVWVSFRLDANSCAGTAGAGG